MIKYPAFVAWRVQCASPVESRRIAQFARNEVGLDNIMERTRRAFPKGVEETQSEGHKLGEYFDQIAVLPGQEDPNAFRLVFHPRPDADRYWKDIMVRLLRRIQDAAPPSAITIDRAENDEQADSR